MEIFVYLIFNFIQSREILIDKGIKEQKGDVRRFN